MNRDEFSQAKHLDGIYKSHPIKKGPIQVELGLDDAKKIPVNWKKSNIKVQEHVSAADDKFYSIATAALTGTKPPKSRLSRMRRNKRSDLPTVGELVRLAESVEVDGQDFNDSYVQKIVASRQAVVKSATKSYNSAKALLKKKLTIKRKIQPSKTVSPTNSYKTMLILQFVVILVLAFVLAFVVRSYSQYRSSSIDQMQVQKQQYEQKWAEVETTWQCINDQWNSLQAAYSTGVKPQEKISC